MQYFKSDIVVITALHDPEFKEFQKAFKELGGKFEPAGDRDSVSCGWLPSQRKPYPFLVYAAWQTRPGLAGAASLAAKLIERYRPQYLAMVGIAAGPREKAKHGDVIIADFVANYQAGKLTAKGFVRDGTGIPLDDAILRKLQESMDDIMEHVNDKSGGSCKAHIGPILAGDQVVASKEFMESLKGHTRKLVGVEMEGFAIFNAAMQSNAKPILIKSVCDFGDESKDDEHQKLASLNSARFFLQFVLKKLKPLKVPIRVGDLELIPLNTQKGERGKDRLIEVLEKCEKPLIRMISITGASVFAPRATSVGADPVTEALRGALERGSRCQGILLDPNSAEARVRVRFESPKYSDRSNEPDESKQLLTRDSRRVMAGLTEAEHTWRRFIDKDQLQIRYSTIGLSFNLWLFPDEARLEPYHFGKRKGDRPKPSSPLCGFSHIWIKRGTTEYQILEDHFEKLWNKCGRSLEVPVRKAMFG